MKAGGLKYGVVSVGILVGLAVQVAGTAEPGAATVDLVPIPHPRVMLLRDSVVHRDLRLEPEQIAGVRAAVDAVDLPLWRLRDRSADERNEPAEGLLARLEGEIATILSDQQRARLDQLTLQALGIQGLVDPEIAEKLRLSTGQVERMREAIAALARERALLQQGGVTEFERRRAHILQRQAEQNALAWLDRDQQRTLRRLTGRSFDFSGVRQRACRAPELRGVETWIHSGPVTLASLRGNVVVVHFYTFGCINCIRNLPHYVGWQKRFASQPVHLVGIHRPETQGERVVGTVRQKAAEAGLTHPIAIDNESANWDAWGNHIWPSVYLVDKQGFVRYWWYGELNWQGAPGERWMRRQIEELLAEED